VNSEQELKTGLRQALDQALPPVPWLETAVTEDFRRRLDRSADRSEGQSRRGHVVLRRPLVQLAAGLLVLALAAAATATFIELRYHSPQSTPAGSDSKAYQSMVNRDVDQADSSGDGTSFATLQSTCPMPGRPVLAALQRWLGDLDGFQTPSKFAVIDGQLRRHLVSTSSVLNAVVTAYQAQDQTGLDSANYALSHQFDWLDTVAQSIVQSGPVDAPAYIVSVRIAKQSFDACSTCRALIVSGQPDCSGIQGVSCQHDVFVAMSTIEPFEANLVRYSPPSSLAARDLVLQRDLAQADTAVLAMANAQLTGDQAGFTAGLVLLRQVWPAIDADAAGIVGSQ
jgi:hypothetical protein